jgi:hypothetical protein
MPMRIGGAALVAASALVAAVAICAPATIADGLAAARQRLAPQLAGRDPLAGLTAGGSAYIPVSQPAAAPGAPAGLSRRTSIYVIILRERVPERRGA